MISRVKLQQVYQFWAVPNLNPAMLSLHKTGTAIDLGSPIDEISERSFPHHFAKGSDFYQRRQLLNSSGDRVTI